MRFVSTIISFKISRKITNMKFIDKNSTNIYAYPK